MLNLVHSLHFSYYCVTPHGLPSGFVVGAPRLTVKMHAAETLTLHKAVIPLCAFREARLPQFHVLGFTATFEWVIPRSHRESGDGPLHYGQLVGSSLCQEL